MLAADHRPSHWFSFIFCWRYSSGKLLFCQLHYIIVIAYGIIIWHCMEYFTHKSWVKSVLNNRWSSLHPNFFKEMTVVLGSLLKILLYLCITFLQLICSSWYFLSAPTMSRLKWIWYTQASVCVLPSSLSCGCGWGCQQHMLFVAPFKWSKLEHCVVHWSCPSIAHFSRFRYFPVYVDGAHTRSVTRWEIFPKLENYNYTSLWCSICVSVTLLSSVFDSSLSSEAEIFSTNSSLSNMCEVSLVHRLFLLLEAKFAYWNSYLSAQ